MSGSVNKAILVGNLGRDPEVRTTTDGTKVANLSVATSESWKDKASGNWKERTEWHRITVWGDGLVGIVEKHLSKGAKVYLEGQIQTRKWTDKDGHDRYSTEIVLQGFTAKLVLIDRAEGDDEAETDAHVTAARGGYGTGGYGAGNGRKPMNDLDDDIPF